MNTRSSLVDRVIRLLIPVAGLTVVSTVAIGSVAFESQSFHFMQIEEVIGGIDGDTAAQAIALRTRAPFQNFVTGASIWAEDAQGLNPIEIITFDSNMGNTSAGARILVATPEFQIANTPNARPDFLMTNRIPDSYLPAGRIVFRGPSDEILWSLAWGGTGYTGPNTGEFTNDADGDFGPPFDGPLPSTTTQALHFQGRLGDMSTTNADDYQLTPGPAVFTNNADQQFAVGDGTTFSFEVTGFCPGLVNLTWSGATIGGRVAVIFASEIGNFMIPNGNPCAGTLLGLGTLNIRLVNTASAGANGINSVNGTAVLSECDGFLQLIDVQPCNTSNVERLD